MPETVADSPIIRLDREVEHVMVLEIFDTVNDFVGLVAPAYVASPSQLAVMLHDPASSGVYVSL